MPKDGTNDLFDPEGGKMSVLVADARVLTTGFGLLIILFAIALAQTPAPRSDTRSYEIGTLLEGEAYMIGKDMRLHRSNVGVTAAQHETALKKGANQLRSPVVIHRWGDKLFMMDNVGRNAPVNFEDQFILDP